MKNRNFRPICRFFSEMVQDRTTVTVKRRKELYAIYRMVPFPITPTDPWPRF